MTRVTIKVLRILLIRVRSPTPVVALKSAACSPRRLLPFCLAILYHTRILLSNPPKSSVSSAVQSAHLSPHVALGAVCFVQQGKFPLPYRHLAVWNATARIKNFFKKIERRFPYRSAFFCKMSSFSVSFLLSVDQCQNEDSDSGNQNHFCHVQNQVHIHKIHPPFSKMHVFKII